MLQYIDLTIDMANNLNRKILKICELVSASPFLIAKLPMELGRFKKALFLLPEEEVDKILASAVASTINMNTDE